MKSRRRISVSSGRAARHLVMPLGTRRRSCILVLRAIRRGRPLRLS
jgi:hypothetical protein